MRKQLKLGTNAILHNSTLSKIFTQIAQTTHRCSKVKGREGRKPFKKTCPSSVTYHIVVTDKIPWNLYFNYYKIDISPKYANIMENGKCIIYLGPFPTTVRADPKANGWPKLFWNTICLFSSSNENRPVCFENNQNMFSWARVPALFNQPILVDYTTLPTSNIQQKNPSTNWTYRTTKTH